MSIDKYPQMNTPDITILRVEHGLLFPNIESFTTTILEKITPGGKYILFQNLKISITN